MSALAGISEHTTYAPLAVPDSQASQNDKAVHFCAVCNSALMSMSLVTAMQWLRLGWTLIIITMLITHGQCQCHCQPATGSICLDMMPA